MGQPKLASRVATQGQVEAAARRRRSGSRPEWARILTPAERLTSAAMALLMRDPRAGARLRSLNDAFPDCLGRPTVGRSLAAHANWHRTCPARTELPVAVEDRHRTCLAWTESLVGVAYDLGCPSLDALLFQLECINRSPAYRPGSVVSHRLAADVTRPSRSRRGVIDHPARLLLTRRWRLEVVGGGVTVQIAASRWLDLVQGWVDGEVPERLDITYPAWLEWIGHRRSRSLMLLPPEERQSVFESWSRGGVGAPNAGPDAGQALRKAHAKVERILRMSLPAPSRRPENDSS